MLLYCGMIFYASSQRVSLPSGLRRIPHIDKMIHFTLYGFMGLICYPALHFSYFLKPALLTVLIVFLYGLSDEIHQLFVAGRSFELLDLLADLLGAIVAVWLSKKIVKHLPQRWHK